MAFIDDDPSKRDRRVGDVPVAGTCKDLPRVLATTRAEAVILTPRLDEARLREVQAICLDAGATLLRLEVRLDVVILDADARLIAASIEHT